jgi:acyl-CoA thioester hydrolase
MRALGYAYADIERSGVRLAVADLSIRYAQAARYDDAIRITTRVAAAQSRTITFDYVVAREADNVVLATATTRLIAIDDSGAVRRLPAELVERFRGAASP